MEQEDGSVTATQNIRRPNQTVLPFVFLNSKNSECRNIKNVHITELSCEGYLLKYLQTRSFILCIIARVTDNGRVFKCLPERDKRVDKGGNFELRQSSAESIFSDTLTDIGSSQGHPTRI